jgi:hypothetical protein
MSTAKIRWFAGMAATAGLLGAGAALAPVASAQTAQPTLSGESFSLSTPPTGSFTCTSATGPFSFTVSGTATGPYPGTFTETGSGTLTSADGFGDYTLSGLAITFTISSAAGDVTGTETLPVPVTNGGMCYTDPADFTFRFVSTGYQATIAASGGEYSDQGNALPNYFESQGSVGAFTDQFTSSQSQATLTAPTSKDQCKDDGWQNYPQFPNQGQCVAYVEHNGS